MQRDCEEKKKNKWKRQIRQLLCGLCVLTAAVPAGRVSVSFAAESQTEAEAPQETEIIRVGCFPLNGFFDQSGDSWSGYGCEYTDTVAKIAGWEYEYISYPSWVEALDGLEQGEIDILAPAERNAEREELYEFDAFPIGTEYGSLLTLNTSDSLIYEDYEAFDDLKVGCVKSLIFLDDFEAYEKKNGFHANMTWYKDTPALVAALNAGEVDAIVANLMVKTDTMKILARFGAAPYYYMVNADQSNLLAELNTAVDQLSSQQPEFQHELDERYFPKIGQTPFSKEEIDYITEAGAVKVAVGSDYAPFSYKNKEGELVGVDLDILEQISQISGLKFEYVAVPEEADAISFAKENHIALVAGIENSSQTKNIGDTSLTAPYLEVPKYFMGSSSREFDLDANLRACVITASAEEIQYFQNLYPAFTFERYTSVEACMKAIRQGNADVVLDNRYSMELILSAPRNKDLKILPSLGISTEICFGLPSDGEKSDDDVLLSILNKSISRLSKEDSEHSLSVHAQDMKYEYSFSDFIYLYRNQILFVSAIVAICAIAVIFAQRARRKTQRTIAANEIKLRNITNNINGGVVVMETNQGLHITYANDGFLEMIGCTRQEFEQSDGSYLAYVHPDDLHKMEETMKSEGNEVSLELRVLKNNGSYVPALFHGSFEKNMEGEWELYCVIMDMTEQIQLVEQLKFENSRTELILSKVEEIFYEIDYSTKSILVSNSFFDKLGWSLPGSFADKNDEELKAMWRVLPEDFELLRGSTLKMKEKKEAAVCTVRLEEKGQHYIWCDVIQYPILSEKGALVSIIGMIKDVNEVVLERERLQEQAQKDLLTGLYNKETFEELATTELQRLPNQNHALLFIDLDYFKSVNDTLGHMMGDRAICEAADKLRIIFSHYDLISRFGGDEFCVFVKNIPQETLQGKLDWMVEKLHADYSGEKGSVHITCSCGVAFTKDYGFSYKDLMREADRALYESKENGRNQYTIAKNS